MLSIIWISLKFIDEQIFSNLNSLLVYDIIKLSIFCIKYLFFVIILLIVFILIINIILSFVSVNALRAILVLSIRLLVIAVELF